MLASISTTYNFGLLYHTFVHGTSMLAFGLVLFRPAMTDSLWRLVHELPPHMANLQALADAFLFSDK